MCGIQTALSMILGDLEIQATLTNHNHEELVENVEVYNVTFVRSIEKRTVMVRVPMDADIRVGKK